MSNIKLSDQYKEAFSIFQTRSESKDIINWLKIQKNNIAVLSWSRVRSTDKDIAIKKSRYEGNIEMIDIFLQACELSKKGEE